MNRRSPLGFSPGAAGPLFSRELTLPSAITLSWQDQAVCAQTDPEAFFPEKGGSTREAKRVCRSCPVRAECLEYALANDERFGIWGGLSERERRRLKARSAPAVCPAGLHEMTAWNTLRFGKCRACKQAAEGQPSRHDQGLAA